ncbi:MAG: hypothetical protein WCO44_12740 [Bacteroidota bacterium]
MSDWSKLYALADNIIALKPWRYMYEDEIMGVRDPSTGTIGFLSVMGNLGEHYSITVYLGEEALGQYLQLTENSANASAEMVLEIPQLMLSFEEKEFLEKEDLAIMKANGVKISGKNLWPMFRSYRPGMVPWFFEEQEMKSMVNFLEQFLEVVTATTSVDLKPKQGKGKGVYFVRECKKEGDLIQWEDTRQKIEIPAAGEIRYEVDPGLLAESRSIPIRKNIYAVDFFLTPAQVREQNKRPFFSYMLLIVDERSELVISSEILDPSSGIERMLAEIPSLLLKALSQGKSLPQAVYAGSPRIAFILAPLMKSLGIKIQYKTELRALEMAKMAIFDFFSRG